MMRLLLIFLLLFSIQSNAYEGQLDSTFGPFKNGTIFVNFNSTSSSSRVNAVLLQNDGKIVVAGLGKNNRGDLNMAVARYTSDGKLDTTFNKEGSQPGLALPNFGPNAEYTEALGAALQDGENIVLGGYNRISLQAISQAALACYNMNGTLNTSFNPYGKFPGTLIPNLAKNAEISAIATQSDGKIIVMGSIVISEEPRAFLARYNLDGSLDTSFNKNGPIQGVVIITFGVAEDFLGAHSLKLQPDKKIIAIGNVGSEFYLARFMSDGTPDKSFGTDTDHPGIVFGSFEAHAGKAYSVLLQHDGKILVVGESGYDFVFARYNPDGSLDKTLNPDSFNPGVVFTQINGFNFAGARAAALHETTGKIIAGGYAETRNSSALALVRYDMNGTLDTTFNPQGSQPGVVTTQFNDPYSYVLSIAIQDDGKIVVGGYNSEISTGTSESFPILMRYL